MEFYFGEHLRLDWGLGNPNKTAVLIACLLVLIQGLRFLPGKKSSWFVFVIAFAALGGCLIHTYSRGGLLAALVGQILFWGSRSRWRFFPVPKAGALLFALLFLILFGYAASPQVEATARYTQGAVPGGQEDRSISNRLRIWKDVPRMMADSPDGWGVGNAGHTWMQWYQPLDTRYQYRTLVNSHFTWLVEFNWLGRFAYVAAWVFLFTILISGGKKETPPLVSLAQAIALGVSGAFFVGAIFSSVAEDFVLWVIPLVTVALWSASAFFYWMRRQSEDRATAKNSLWKKIGLASGLTGFLLLSALVWGLTSRSGKARIRGNVEWTSYGALPHKVLVYRPDPSVVGRHFGHDIRRAETSGFLIANELPDPESLADLQVVVRSGENCIAPLTTPDNVQIICLNPSEIPEKKAGQTSSGLVILGKLRGDSIARDLRLKAKAGSLGWELEHAEGKQSYLSNWISLLSDMSK